MLLLQILYQDNNKKENLESRTIALKQKHKILKYLCREQSEIWKDNNK